MKINSYYDHNKFFNLLTFKIHYKKIVERKVHVVFFYIKTISILFLISFLVFPSHFMLLFSYQI
jgi:hypothetical protein